MAQFARYTEVMAAAQNPAWDPSSSMLDPRIIDPSGTYVQHSKLSTEDLDQVVAVLGAIKAWRESEERTSLSSRSYMRLNETDMKALRYVIAAKNSGVLVTAGMLAEHLQVSTASITKMLDRLEKAHHITRSQHPNDRRAVVISITAHTHADARATIGRKHARRFDVAAQLTHSEREVVIRFLSNMAALEDDGADELGDQNAAQQA